MPTANVSSQDTRMFVVIVVCCGLGVNKPYCLGESSVSWRLLTIASNYLTKGGCTVRIKDNAENTKAGISEVRVLTSRFAYVWKGSTEKRRKRTTKEVVSVSSFH